MKTIWWCRMRSFSPALCHSRPRLARAGTARHRFKNGTFLNEAKLAKPTRLKCGDKIRVCDRQFIFLIKGQPLPPLPSSQTLAE